MAYKIGLPDGRFFDVDDSVPEDEAKAALMQRFPDQFPKAGGFVNATKAGAASGLGSLLRAGAEGLDSFEGDIGAAEWLKKKSKGAHNYANSTFVATPDSAEGVGNWANRNVLEPIGGMAGEFAPVMLGAAGATAVAGPGAGIAAFMAPRIATNYGHNVEYNEQKGIENDPGANAMASIGMSILERFGMGRIVSGPMGSVGLRTAQRVAETELAPLVRAGKLSMDEAAAQLPSLMKNAGVNIAENAASNAAMMGGISVMQRAQAGEDVLDDEALARYGHDAKMAATLAPIFGPLHAGRGSAFRELSKGEEGFYKNFVGPDLSTKDKYEKQQAEYAAMRANPSSDLVSAERPASSPAYLEAGVVPEIGAEKKQIDIADRPQDSSVEPRPQFELADPSKQLQGEMFSTVPEQELVSRTAAPELPFAKITKAEDFKGVVAPQTRAKLAGLNESKVEDVQKIIDSLKDYQHKIRNTENQSEKWAGIKQDVADRIYQYEQKLDALNKNDTQLELLSTAKRGEGRELFDATDGSGIQKADPYPREASEGAPAGTGRDVFLAGPDGVVKESKNGQAEPIPEGAGDNLARGAEQPATPVMDATPAPKPDRGSNGPSRSNRRAAEPSDSSLNPWENFGEAVSSLGEQGVGDGLRVDSLRGALRHPDTTITRRQAAMLMEGLGYDKKQVNMLLRGLEGNQIKDAALGALTSEAAVNGEVMQSGVERFNSTIYSEGAKTSRKMARAAREREESKLGEDPRQYEAGKDVEGEMTTSVKAAVEEGGKLNKALDEIIKSEEDPALVEIAKALRDLDLPTEMEAGKTGAENPGSYSEASDHVTLDTSIASNRTVVHEGVHAATTWALNNKGKLNAAQAAAVARLESLYAQLKEQNPELADKYGFKDVHEFISEAFSSRDFQGALKEIEVGKGDRSAFSKAWDTFVKTISDFLGIKEGNALFEVLDAGSQLFSAERAEQRNTLTHIQENSPAIFQRLYESVQKTIDAKDMVEAGWDSRQGAGTPEYAAALNAATLKKMDAGVQARPHEITERFPKTDLTKLERDALNVAIDAATPKTRFAETRKALMDDVEKIGTKPDTRKGVVGKTSDFVRGVAGDAASAIKDTPRADMWTVIKGWLSDKMYTIEQRFFDEFIGVTRYMPYGAFYKDAKGRQRLNPRALLQKSNYATAIGEAALVYGKIAKNAEGVFTAQKDAANLHALTQAAKAIPGSKNPLQLLNSVLMHLSQAEHEEIRAEYRASAEQMKENSKKLFAASKKLEGSARDDMRDTARAMESQADRLMNNTPDYKRPAGMTDESLAKVRELVATTPELQAAVEINRQMNMNIIETLKQGGIISKEKAAEWSQKKYYSPMFRVMDEQSLPSIGLRSNKPSELKRFEGSERDVDVLSNHVMQTVWTADAVAKNQARTEAVKYFLENPELAKEIGLHRVEAPKGDNIVTIKVDGVDQHYNVADTNAFRSLQGLKEVLPGFMKPLESITHMFREAIMLSPGAMFRNFTRDPMEAFMSSHIDENLAGAYTKAFKQMAGAMPSWRIGANPALAKIKDYGVFQHGITGVRELTKQDRELELIIRRAMQEEGIAPGAGMVIDKMDSVLGRIHHKLQDVARAVEVSTREAVYQDTLKRTGSEHEASLAAINTIDFRRRGDSGAITYARALIPFFNSQLQGMYKIYRTLGRNDNTGMTKENARVALATKMLMMAGAAVAYHSIMDSADPDYKDIPMDVKANNFIVPVGGGMHMRFAIPFEIGAAAWSIPVHLADTAKGNQTYQELAKGIAGTLGNQMPSMLPVIAKPAIEHATNFDFFTGRNIETKAQQGLTTAERKNKDTTGIAEALGPLVGTSPVKFDHLMNGYFGSVGKHVLGVADAMLGNNSGKPDTQWHRTQAGKVLFVDPDRTKQTDQFYDLKNKVDETYNTVELMKKEGRGPDLMKFLKEDSALSGMSNQQAYAYHQALSDISRKLAEIRKAEGVYRNMPSDQMSDEQKMIKLRELKVIQNTIVKQVARPLRVAVGWENP